MRPCARERWRVRWVALATALVASGAAPRAWAAEDGRPEVELFADRHRPEASPWVERPLALEAQAALGGPLGLLGGAVDWSPSPGFSANLGAGLGHATGSLQLGANLRLRIVLTRGFAVGAEGGLAGGEHRVRLGCDGPRCPPEWHWDAAVWGNAGLLLEARGDGGLALRWSFGGAAIFNVVDGTCVRCDATDEPNMWTTTVPYTVLAVGWAFAP